MKIRYQVPFALACLAVLLVGTGSLGAQQIQWAPDLAAAKTEATRSGKPILLHFGASWCRPCQEVETFVFRNPAVIRKLNDTVVPVRLDFDQNPQLASEFGVKSLPTDVVITTSEKVLQKRNSPTEASGYTLFLDEIARSRQALETDGPAVLNERTQLTETWDRNRTANGDVAGLTPFDQQRPLAPAADQAGRSAGFQLSPVTATQSMTGEVRTGTGAASAQQATASSAGAGGQGNSSPQAVSNPFALTPATGNSPAGKQAGPEGAELHNSAPTELLGTAAAGVTDSHLMLTSGSVAVQRALALDGDCPVTLLKATKWVKGNEELGAMHRGRLYLFASPEAQAEFLRDPEAYSPLLAGYDPVLFRDEGRLVVGRKTHGVFMTREGKQQVVLFESDETRAKFRANALPYLESIRLATEQADRTR